MFHPDEIFTEAGLKKWNRQTPSSH